MTALGSELIATNLFGLIFPLSNVYKFYLRGGKNTDERDDWAIVRAIRYVIAFLFGIAGATILIKLALWGMYMVTISYVTLLVLVVLNTWSIMFMVGQTEKTKRTD
jgi:hypothetical protein